MGDFDEKKRSAAQTFGTIVRLSSASGQLDPQQLMVVMTQLLAPLPEGGALDLAPLEKFLREEKKISPTDIEEIFIFFQSKEDKLGFSVVLPPSMANVTDARRTRILEKFQKAPQPATYSGGKEPSGATPPARQQTIFDQKRPPPREGVSRRLVAATALVVILGGGYLVYLQGETVPDVVAVTSPLDATMLPCTDVKVRGDFAFCELKSADLAKLSRDELRKKGEATLARLASHGAKNLSVRTVENRKPVIWR